MVPPSASLRWMLPARSGGSGSGGISMGSCTGSHPACPRPPASLVHLSVHFQDHPRCRSGARHGHDPVAPQAASTAPAGGHRPLGPTGWPCVPHGRRHLEQSTSGGALTLCRSYCNTGRAPVGSCIYLRACGGRSTRNSLFNPFPSL